MRPAGFPKRIIGILLLAASMTAGEALAGKPPDRVQGESSHYPRERYLIGVGSGDVRKAAEARALRVVESELSQEIGDRLAKYIFGEETQ